MERRQLLKCLVAGGLWPALSAPLNAQQGAPRPPSTPPRVANNEGAPGVRLATPEALQQVLKEWEEKTAIITRLRGDHQRYEYDSVFGIEKRSIGEFWHEAPDKGKIEFNEAPITDPKTGEPLISSKKLPSGERYKIETDEPMTWVCDGQAIIQVDHLPKTYGMIEIPPQHQGENILNSPLPFLFGMEADKMQERYQLSIGTQHDKTGSDGRRKYHVVAAPKMPEDASNWQRAEVILDAEYCLPSAIRLIDPGGSKETVYVFPLGAMKANEKVWLRDPFKLSLRGYKMVESQSAPPAAQRPAQGQNVLRASKSESLGRAPLNDTRREQ